MRKELTRPDNGSKPYLLLPTNGGFAFTTTAQSRGLRMYATRNVGRAIMRSVTAADVGRMSVETIQSRNARQTASAGTVTSLGDPAAAGGQCRKRVKHTAPYTCSTAPTPVADANSVLRRGQQESH